MLSYDYFEAIRNANQWIGATAKAAASIPAMSVFPNPSIDWIAAWGQVTERSFERMTAKPDWGIESITCYDGRDHLVEINKKITGAFGDLIHFNVLGREPAPRKILLVAPMSGHYSTLLRSTVNSLIIDSEIYVTDWHNARDIPVSEGSFDIEDYTKYLIDYIKFLGPDINVIAICQPAPLALVATAFLAQEKKDDQPKSLILMGGPIDPSAAPTEITEFGNKFNLEYLEQTVIQRVGFKYAGVGRQVYPGLLQLMSFMSMNAEKHAKSFSDQIARVAQGTASEHDKHNSFYDEYLAVMDMTAEFYLSTVDRIFKKREIAQNKFNIMGKHVDIDTISNVAIMTIEGGKDDISAPGQCSAAIELCRNVPPKNKYSYVEPDAGHYGIFAGKNWRTNIRPKVIEFIDSHQ